MGGVFRRLRPVPEPAQEAECALAQDQVPEQGGSDDGEHHHYLYDGESLAENGMKHSDADRNTERSDAGAHRPPRRAFSECRWQRTSLAAGAVGIRLSDRMDVGDKNGLVDVPVGDRETVARHARAPLRGSAPVPNSGRLRRGFPRVGSMEIRRLAFREEPSHTFTQHGCAFIDFAPITIQDEAAASWDATPMTLDGRRACPRRAADAQGALQPLPPRSPPTHDPAGRG